MLKKDELVKKIAKRKDMDERVVRLVADYPFKFVRDKIADPGDWRPIRIRYLAVFSIKSKFTNKGILPNYNALKQI